MIRKLYIEISSMCNLKCSMCFRNSWLDNRSGLMSDLHINRLMDSFSAQHYPAVVFGGMGEPLVHNRLAEMVSAASNAGSIVEIITNGTLLTEKRADELVKAGLSRIWISMDAFTKAAYEEVRKGSLFELICSNLESYDSVRGNSRLGITFVMMKENLKELEYINSFAQKYGADTINLSHVIPGTPLQEEDKIYDSPYPIGRMPSFQMGNGQSAHFPECPFIHDDACFIRWDGEVIPCMQLLHSCYTYLDTLKRTVYARSFGNISNESPIQIWDSKPYRNFRDRVREFDFPSCTTCEGCDMRLDNMTDCLYNEFPTCGACLWAQGHVFCP